MTPKQKENALEHLDESLRRIVMRYEIKKLINYDYKVTNEQIEEIINYYNK